VGLNRIGGGWGGGAQFGPQRFDMGVDSPI
jgi:hypothetical protein